MNIIGGREHPLLWVYDNGTESHQNGTLTLASARIEELSVTRSRSACQPERFRPKLERPLRGKLLSDAVRRGYPYARGRSRLQQRAPINSALGNVPRGVYPLSDRSNARDQGAVLLGSTAPAPPRRRAK